MTFDTTRDEHHRALESDFREAREEERELQQDASDEPSVEGMADRVMEAIVPGLKTEPKGRLFGPRSKDFPI